MTTAPAAPRGFASLAELQANHATLVKEVGKDIRAPANLERIAQFVRKGVATGTVLDAPTDRAAAQSLIIFWITRLASAKRDGGKDRIPVQIPEFEDTLLEEFSSDDLVAAVIAPTEEWLKQKSSMDQTLARRLMLRLVSLREDGSFDVLPSASGIDEDLAPQDRAEKVLAELVRLGVVRSTRNPFGYQEFALRSAELLKRWPRLQEWMAERQRFRQKATAWAQRRAEKAADRSKQSFLRRTEKAFRVAVHNVGAWIEARWRAWRMFFNLRVVTEEFLAEDDYEEAEAYRDKNAVEFRLLYQKRQLDKERDERRQVRVVAFAAAAIVFATLAGVAIWGWVEAYKAKEQERTAKEQEEKAKKLANLQIASWQLERGAQLEADDRDTSGAFLWYAAAWSKFDASADVLDRGERERLRASYLLRLGTAKEQLPFLSGMAYHKHSGESGGALARTPDGRILLTVGADEDGRTTSPIVRFWRWTDRRGEAGWEPSVLPWGQSSPKQAFAQAGAYVSPDGRFAIVSGAPKDTDEAVYVWEIPENGPGRFIGELKGYEGKLTSAGFSPDGRFFAVVSQRQDNKALPLLGASSVGLMGTLLGQGPLLAVSALIPERTDCKGKVNLWRSDSWDGPIELALPPESLGALGQLAFCPTPTSKRLAVAVGPVQAPLGKDQVICLEWSLKEPLGEAVPRQYVERVLGASPPGEFLTFVTYKPDGRVLLVSRSLQNSSRAWAWLFETKEDPTPQEPTPPLQSLSPAGPVLHAVFSPWDDRLVIASADGTAVLWSQLATGQGEKHYWPIRTLGHKAQVFKADFSPDGQYIVTASRDYRALVWHADSGQLAHPSLHHSGSVTDAGFTEHGRCVITSCRDTIYRWDLTRGESRPLPLGTMRGVRTTSADPEMHLVVTAGEHRIRGQVKETGWARVWDTETGDPRSPELQHPSPVHHAALSGAGQGFVSTITIDGEVRVWETSSGRQLWSEKPKEGMAVYSAFGYAEGEAHLLALIRSDPRSLSSDSYLRIYPLNSKGEPTDAARTFQYKAPFTAAAFSPGCKYVIAYTGDGAGDYGVAVVWKVRSESKDAIVLKGKRGRKGTAHDEAITHVAFTRHGDYLVTASRDDKAFVWDLRDGSSWELVTQAEETGRPGDILGHTGDIVFASFDRAGARVVTAGADGWAIVWQRAPDQQKFLLVQKLKNSRALTHAIFSTDERYLVTADTGGKICLWDGSNGRLLATKYHPGQILRLGCREDKSGHSRVYLLGNQARSGPASSMGPGQGPDFSGADPSVGAAWPVVTEWRLTSAAPPGDDDKSIAQWTASRQVIYRGDHQELTSLDQDVIFNLWKETRTRSDRTSTWSRAEEARWHEREAVLCELVGRWGAALEHWNRALKDGSAGSRQPVLRALKEGSLEGLLPNSDLWRASELLRARAEARQQDPSKLEGVISDYLQVLKVNPDDGLARAQLADAYLKSNQFLRAMEEYDEAVKRDGQNPDLLLKRARVLMKLGSRCFNRAYEDYLAAARLFKARRRFDDAAAAYYGAVGLFKYGIERSRQVQAAVHAELAGVQVNRAVSTRNEQQREKSNRDACKHFLKAINLDDTVWTYWSGLARCRRRLQEWKEARQAFDEAIKRNPNNVLLARDRAEALIQLKDWDEAAKAYRAIIEAVPKVLSHRLSLAAIYLQPIPPDKEVRPERLEEARRCLAEAAKDFPEESITWLNLAVVQLAAGKTNEYQATRARLFEAFKTPTAVAANNVAWAAALAKDTPEGAERAVKLAERAVRGFPRNTNYLNTYGAVLYRARKREEAIVQLQRATKERALAYLSPDQMAYDNALALLFMAMAQYTPEQREQARETLRSAVQTIEPLKPAQQSESPKESLVRVWQRLEFEILRREAEKLINP